VDRSTEILTQTQIGAAGIAGVGAIEKVGRDAHFERRLRRSANTAMEP